nr:PIN domain-containing protein [uncultured Agathobacter sp.]
MVLVDTNVIIDIWKNKAEDVIELFEKEAVCICGVIRSELMHGAYSDKNLEEISRKLDYITEINLADNEWDEFGRFLYKLRTNGLSVPYADAIIAFIAIKNGLSLLTRDKHFKLIQVIDPRLKLL